MKNKKEYDEEIALQELQPNKYSNEDQMNMTSSTQSESNEKSIFSPILPVGVIQELAPWNHLDLDTNKVEPKPIPDKKPCDTFDEVIKSQANFEKMMNMDIFSKIQSACASKTSDDTVGEEGADDIFEKVANIINPFNNTEDDTKDEKGFWDKAAEAIKNTAKSKLGIG